MEEFEKIENVFRTSSSSEELFDAFQDALKCRLKSLESYKILLANPCLTPDEIKLFTERIITELPNKAYDINVWTAGIFENNSAEYERLEDSLNYYERAHYHIPIAHEPLLKLLGLYNYELDYPSNKEIVSFIELEVETVNKKSKVYYALANHYRKVGNYRMEVKYLSLAEKTVIEERE